MKGGGMGWMGGGKLGKMAGGGMPMEGMDLGSGKFEGRRERTCWVARGQATHTHTHIRKGYCSDFAKWGGGQ